MNRQSSWDGGYSSSAYDRYVQQQTGNKKSVANRMQQQYWVTKQAMIKKLGRKEDEYVVAGDSELDSKLEVFTSIQKTCMDLLRIIEKYQDNLCSLSQEEGAMGRFLKQGSSIDKTRAGKMMAAVGKAQTSSSEQRLALRPPLARLYQEIETFRYRAISDTLMTINRMEGARLEYRAALLWMKDISKELDPDTYKQLEKFRKVQGQVRATKARFEKLKNDVCQKVDLLGASRCNLFSHTLASYQNTLLHFWEKTSRTMSAVQEGFRGYQHYEFNMLKELSETSKQLAQLTGAKDIVPDWEEEDKDTKERERQRLSRNDLSEASKQLAEETNPRQAARSTIDEAREVREENGNGQTEEQAVRQRLISLGEDSDVHSGQANQYLDGRNNGLHEQWRQQSAGEANLLGEAPSLQSPADRERTAFMSLIGGQEEDGTGKEEFGAYTSADLMTGELPTHEDDRDEMELLNEILNTPSTIPTEEPQLDSFDSFLGGALDRSQLGQTEGEGDGSQNVGRFLPSDLLEITAMMGEIPTTGSNDPNSNLQASGSYPLAPTDRHAPLMASSNQDLFHQNTMSQQLVGNKEDSSKPQAFKKGQKADMSAWFNLFADLDPLSNPDAVGREEGQEPEERNC